MNKPRLKEASIKIVSPMMKSITLKTPHFIIALLLGVCAHLAQAQQLIPAPPQLAATAYLLIDANTGEVLVENNADERVPPASLTKMMTSYIVSSEVGRGNVSPLDMVNISVRAWKMGGSKMFVREGTQVSVEDLLRGVIIQSGNDASVALAEHIAGSEEGFADVMNQQAAILGMSNTAYRNATGWPAEGHYTSARDLAVLARAIINDYPEHYAIYAEEAFTYNNIEQLNRNRLLFLDKSIDGLKTGHTEEAGYCLVASGVKSGMRLISVVLGTRSEKARAAESQKLLSYGFRYYETHQAFRAGQLIANQRVWGGQAQEVSIGVEQGLALTIPRRGQERLKQEIVINEVIEAPVEKGQSLGQLSLSLDGKTVAEIPLVALEAVEPAGFFARLWDSIKLFVLNLFV
ncbi:MAG: D-alanyl-D-alanine carboxypeptidase [Cellvibrionaceae bacterium]|nr:D-alanyl-D-alanine carboxypeptidase [Cellvibrionaceae bacterium]MCV6628045.1 D-alanyl-D-alanine carboxypeptidase [Cellvibrionaceae bacterium]